MENEEVERDEQHEDAPQDDSADPDGGSERDGAAAGTVEEREAIARDEDGPFD